MFSKIGLRIKTLHLALIPVAKKLRKDLFLPFCRYLFDRFLLILLEFTPKQTSYPAKNITIATMLCHRDIAAYLITIKSLIHSSRLNFKYLAFNDGTLTPTDVDFLEKHNGIKVVPFSEKNLPESRLVEVYYWQYFKFKPLLSRFKGKIYYIDSDIIFHRYPREFFSRNSEVMFMKDRVSRYSFSASEIKEYLKIDLVECVNTGMLAVPKNRVNYDLLIRKVNSMKKAVLKSREVDDYFYDQTLCSLLFSLLRKSGLQVAPLPDKYFLFGRSIFSKDRPPKDVVCVHYTNYFADRRRKDSFKYLIRHSFFRNSRI